MCSGFFLRPGFRVFNCFAATGVRRLLCRPIHQSMNFRSVVLIIAGMVLGLALGVFAARQFSKSAGQQTSSKDALQTNADGAPVSSSSSFKPFRDRDVESAAKPKSSGPLSLEELPAAIERVLNEPTSKRYPALME